MSRIRQLSIINYALSIATPPTPPLLHSGTFRYIHRAVNPLAFLVLGGLFGICAPRLYETRPGRAKFGLFQHIFELFWRFWGRFSSGFAPQTAIFDWKRGCRGGGINGELVVSTARKARYERILVQPSTVAQARKAHLRWATSSQAPEREIGLGIRYPLKSKGDRGGPFERLPTAAVILFERLWPFP